MSGTKIARLVLCFHLPSLPSTLHQINHYALDVYVSLLTVRLWTLTDCVAGFLEQAKAAATSAANTAGNLASQAATTTSNLANQAYNSQAAASAAEGAKNLGSQAAAVAGNLANAAGGVAGGVAGQVHQQAHSLAPSVVPAPGAAVSAGVDKSSDLEPQSTADRAKLDKLFADRASADELQEKGILKGECWKSSKIHHRSGQYADDQVSLETVSLASVPTWRSR